MYSKVSISRMVYAIIGLICLYEFYMAEAIFTEPGRTLAATIFAAGHVALAVGLAVALVRKSIRALQYALVVFAFINPLAAIITGVREVSGILMLFAFYGGVSGYLIYRLAGVQSRAEGGSIADVPPVNIALPKTTFVVSAMLGFPILLWLWVLTVSLLIGTFQKYLFYSAVYTPAIYGFAFFCGGGFHAIEILLLRSMWTRAREEEQIKFWAMAGLLAGALAGVISTIAQVFYVTVVSHFGFFLTGANYHILIPFTLTCAVEGALLTPWLVPRLRKMEQS